MKRKHLEKCEMQLSIQSVKNRILQFSSGSLLIFIEPNGRLKDTLGNERYCVYNLKNERLQLAEIRF